MQILRKKTAQVILGTPQQKRDFHYVVDKFMNITFGGNTQANLFMKTGLPQKALNKHFISIDNQSNKKLTKQQYEQINDMNMQERVKQYGGKFPKNTTMLIEDHNNVSVQSQGNKVTVSSQLSPIYVHDKKAFNKQTSDSHMEFNKGKGGHFEKSF